MQGNELKNGYDAKEGLLTRRAFIGALAAASIPRGSSEQISPQPSPEVINPLDLFNNKHISVLDNIPGAAEFIDKPVSGISLNLTDLFNKDIALSATHNGIPIRLLQIQLGIMDTTDLWGVNASIHLGFGSVRSETLYLTLGNLEALYLAQQQRELFNDLQYQKGLHQDETNIIIPVLNGSHSTDDLKCIMKAYGVTYVMNEELTHTSEGPLIFVKAICGEKIIFVEGGVPYEIDNTFDITTETPIIGGFLDYVRYPYNAGYRSIDQESA